jgi:hypothetical protein
VRAAAPPTPAKTLSIGRYMKVQRLTTLVILLSVVGFLAFAEDRPMQQQGVPKNKLQVFFSELETQWLKAAQDKDPAALNRIVSDDFQQQTPVPPGNSMSRSDWLLATFGRKVVSFQVRQLAVREVSPTISVVSFVQTETYKESATAQTDEQFVVDIWVNSGAGDNWRCAERYVSEIRGISQK